MADSFQGGHLKDEDGALVVVMEQDVTGGTDFINGLLCDGQGAVVISAKEA